MLQNVSADTAIFGSENEKRGCHYWTSTPSDGHLNDSGQRSSPPPALQLQLVESRDWYRYRQCGLPFECERGIKGACMQQAVALITQPTTRLLTRLVLTRHARDRWLVRLVTIRGKAPVRRTYGSVWLLSRGSPVPLRMREGSSCAAPGYIRAQKTCDSPSTCTALEPSKAALCCMLLRARWRRAMHLYCDTCVPRTCQPECTPSMVMPEWATTGGCSTCGRKVNPCA
jgi:hypothetical protein